MMLAAFADNLLFYHIGSAIIGDIIFLVAFACSLIYLRRYRQLKQKKLTHNFFSSLSTLERFIELASAIGLIFITISLFSGIAIIFVGTAPTDYLKILWAWLVWGWYISTLFGRRWWGWRGLQGARITIFGTILLVLGLFGALWSWCHVCQQ